MSTKLTINLRDGILAAEGSDEFVRSIYEDFKGEVAKRSHQQDADPPQLVAFKEQPNEADVTKVKSSRRGGIKRSRSATSKALTADYSPKFNANLDLAKLEEFYSAFELKNHREKILVFAVFLRDALGKTTFEADDIFSCYKTLKDKTEIPEAFVQALRDTQNKGGYIELVSPHEIRITIAGENYFNQKIKRKELAK